MLHVDSDAAVQGIAFAFSLINYPNLTQTLEVPVALRNNDLEDAFLNGLAFSLALRDWSFSGFLDKLAPQNQRQLDTVAAANRLLRESRKLGQLHDLNLASLS